MAKFLCHATVHTNFLETKTLKEKKICGMNPTLRRRSLNAFITDKEMFLYPIRTIFSRTYNFTCSLDACPSGSGGYGYLNDMTLHPPNGSVMVDQLTLSSIREWETGSSRSALVS